MNELRRVRLSLPIYGGDVASEDGSVTLPFVLRNEVVEVTQNNQLARVIEPVAARVQPRCPHFGSCGGCQYQMIAADEQPNIKRDILRGELHKHGVELGNLTIETHAAETYSYRNRIRLRIEEVDCELRIGYNVRGTTQFLPITTCPIASPLLIETAFALLAVANADAPSGKILLAAHEVELFANHDLSRVQVTVYCTPRLTVPRGAIEAMLTLLRQRIPQTSGLAIEAFDPRTGPTGRTLAASGAEGLIYNVAGEPYWVPRGAFFQVNRFLVETMVRLVTANHAGTARSGALAWDLFAGVGLFSRILARSFASVTAVEANPIAASALAAALRKLGPQHRTVPQTTLDFLRAAVLQRDRPSLIVLDPPRAGVGVEACELLARIAAPEIVYVSCDPTTLARDLAILAPHYVITALDLVDMFPQTFHIETIATLTRR